MPTEIRLLTRDDQQFLEAAGERVFDHPVRPSLAQEFHSDPRHHIVGAVDSGALVGFVTAVDYVHPDKPREMWVNEVGVAESHRGQGIGKRMLDVMFDHARKLGCSVAWVLTEDDNRIAQKMYSSAGGVSRSVVYFEFSL
jgi:ribosomal protein S18 acetylase RimI-like enzyme